MEFPPPDPDPIVARYRRLREVARGLNNRLVDKIPPGAPRSCGKALGLVRDGKLDLSADSEVAVLMDYCLYHHREEGRTPVDRLRGDTPADPQSDEWTLLDAMANSWYSLFEIRAVEPGFGVAAFDILRGEDVVLVDLHLSLTTQAGAIVATQVVEPEGIAMCTGALLPVTPEAFEGIRQWLAEFDATGADRNPTRLTPEQEDLLAAGIIRACITGGSSRDIRYGDLPPGPPDTPPSPSTS